MFTACDSIINYTSSLALWTTLGLSYSTRLWRCTFKEEDTRWQCWSPALVTCLEKFKPIASGGMIPPERLPTACKGGGLRKHKNASSSLLEPFHQDLEVHLQRGGYTLAVLVSSSATCLENFQGYCHWWNDSTRKATHCMQNLGLQGA